MHCPSEIAVILLSILQTGLVRIRTFAWQGRTELCAIESNHVHNLQNLITNYSPEKLFYYWDIDAQNISVRYRPSTRMNRLLYGNVWARSSRRSGY